MHQILQVLMAVIDFYTLVIFVWVILSWFQTASKTVRDIYKVLDTIVAPYVNIFRKFIPPLGGMDFSPLVALIVLQLISRLLIGFFY